MGFFNNTYKRLFGRSKRAHRPLRNNDSIPNKVVNPPKFPKKSFSWKPSAHNSVMRKRVVQEPLNMSIYAYTPNVQSTRRVNNRNKAKKYPANNNNLLNMRYNNRNFLNLSGSVRGPPPPSRKINARIPNNPFNMFNNQRPVRPNIHDLFAPRTPPNFSRIDPFKGSNRMNENAFKRSKTSKTKTATRASEGLVKALQHHGIRVPRRLPPGVR